VLITEPFNRAFFGLGLGLEVKSLGLEVESLGLGLGLGLEAKRLHRGLVLEEKSYLNHCKLDPSPSSLCVISS